MHKSQTTTNKTRYIVGTSTHWHFAFGAILSQQWNPCTDCKSAQYCTTRGHPYHSPNLHPDPCSCVGMRRGTDRQTNTQTRHTDGRDQYTFFLGYASREM